MMVRTLKIVDDSVMVQIRKEKKIRKTYEVFLLFAMGSQFDHLIAICLARLGVYCLVADPRSILTDDVRMIQPQGIILSGGPGSMIDEIPEFDRDILDIGIPVLGICLGFQMWADHVGCRIVRSAKREFGVHKLRIIKSKGILEGFKGNIDVLESHADSVVVNSNINVLAKTENAEVAAASFDHLHGVQFHPEVSDTERGEEIFSRFCFNICGAKDRFPSADVARKKISSLKEQIGKDKVLLALSGGSDSATVAYLLKNAIGDKKRLCGVYIKGIDRPDDEDYVIEKFGSQSWIDLKVVDATSDFLDALAGKHDMHQKRLAMRGVYKKVLEKEVGIFGAKYIAQGTLYTDICESSSGYSGERKATIKLHHNTGLDFSVPELMPLDDCVKDTGRAIGRSIGVPEDLLIRHPFPGPGLIVRIIGEVTSVRLRIARALDGIFIEELRQAGFYEKTWQAGVSLTDCMTTCTKGDDAAQGLIVIVWAVASVNGFTARAIDYPHDFLSRVAQRMTNEIPEVGLVTYRISDKPPSTIEVG
ncbi:glutamine-hydrolyzing GMP synthase [Candidatus Falkowbacteria bacterium]|nr:glutamine-hydrolyzing GMP synthase [Candidatus Falkowbacteria bacterium]